MSNFATLSQFSSRSRAFGKGKETAATEANSWRKGEQLVDFGSHKPDVWVNGRPLSQDLTLTVEIFNHLKTARVYYPSQTKHWPYNVTSVRLDFYRALESSLPRTA